MRASAQRRTFWLFGILMLYIIAQFSWWAVLLLRKDAEIDQLRAEVSALAGSGEVEGMAPRQLVMILGEAGVVLLFLLIFMVVTFRAIRRDLRLATTQRNFLLAVTHELRTPIAAIKLQLQSLMRPGLAVEQQEFLRTGALEEAERLAMLTDKVLLATTAEEGSVPLDLRALDVMELMRNVVERALAHTVRDHKLVLIGPDTLVVQSDGHALRSIADNLIENAYKYSPAGTTITLEVKKGRNGWRLSVLDEGPGIPIEDHDRVFERFFRGGSEDTRGTKGTGLGLYIVRRLAQRLGGAATVQDRAPRGAIFAVSFPDH